MCYTDFMCIKGKQSCVVQKKILPPCWEKKILLAAVAAAAGNILAGFVIPWPEFMAASYETAVKELSAYSTGMYLFLTLFAAPLFEEMIFRRGIYGVFRRWLGVIPAALLSAFAFGLYHGNWIQGIYGFAFGLLLAWGYETSSFGKYRMAVLMHMAANGAAVLLNVVFSIMF